LKVDQWRIGYNYSKHSSGHCLGKSITTVETVAMEYIMPFYLILLTVFIFIVVELHGRGFKPIVILWRPLAVCLFKFRKEWKITDSLIHTMAAFLLLSYTKLVVVSVRILDGAYLYSVDGKKNLVPFYSAQNDYFHGEHAASPSGLLWWPFGVGREAD